MPKDFFDIVNSYDPTKDVVDLALKKFQMDNEKTKFDMAKSEFDKKQAMDAEELASKNEFMTGLKSMFTPGGTTKPATFGMDSPQAQSGLDAITQPEMTVPNKPPPTAQDIMKLAIEKGYNVDKFLPALVTAQTKTPDDFKFIGNPKNGIAVANTRSGMVETISEPQESGSPLKMQSDIGKLQADKEYYIKQGLPLDHPTIKAIDDEMIKKSTTPAVDAKREQAINKAKDKKESTVSYINLLIEKAKALKAHKGKERIIGYSSHIPVLGGEGADAMALYDSIKSGIGLTTLADLKSGTGAGLGSVTEPEHVLLQNYITGLNRNQTTESFDQTMDNIINWGEGAKERLNNVVERMSEGVQTGTNKPTKEEAIAELRRRGKIK